jgi:predicted transcriptional regulator
MANDETIDWIIEQIRSGQSQASIAKALGVSTGSVSMWLDRDADTIERSARARIASAEAWLDRGLEAVESALMRDSGVDATAARAVAQECARRAAVRNPAYREKTGVEITGAAGGPIRTIATTATPEEAAKLYKDLLG